MIARRLSSTTTNQRKHLQQSLMIALLKHGRIKSTLAAAKSIKGYVEKELTRAKTDTLHNRRIFAAKVYNQQDIVKLLYEKIGPIIAARLGGYLRITKYMTHRADAAPMCVLEFVDFDKIYDLITNTEESTENVQSTDITKNTNGDDSTEISG